MIHHSTFIRYDNQANLFAIISTIEQLEKAYVKDCITPKE